MSWNVAVKTGKFRGIRVRNFSNKIQATPSIENEAKLTKEEASIYRSALHQERSDFESILRGIGIIASSSSALESIEDVRRKLEGMGVKTSQYVTEWARDTNFHIHFEDGGLNLIRGSVRGPFTYEILLRAINPKYKELIERDFLGEDDDDPSTFHSLCDLVVHVHVIQDRLNVFIQTHKIS